MKRGKPLKRSRKRASGLEIAAHARFREIVGSEPCLWSLSRPGHRCQGPLDPHHVIRKQWLKHHFLDLKRFQEEKFWGIVHDPRLGVALCRLAHDRVTTPVKEGDRIGLGELPARVVEAAREYGLEHRLERECGSFFGLGVQPSVNSEQEES